MMRTDDRLQRAIDALRSEAVQRRLRKAWTEQPSCPRCRRHLDPDLPQADRCHCHTDNNRGAASTALLNHRNARGRTQ